MSSSRRTVAASLLVLVLSLRRASAVPPSVDARPDRRVVTLPLLPHGHVVARHLAENGEKGKSLGPLYQGYGTHYVDLWVGSPEPQRQTLIVDTGSQMIAFPCSECKDCGEKFHTDKYFDTSRSDTFETVGCDDCVLGRCYARSRADDKCDVGLSYQEGSSWRAVESSDVVYVGGYHETSDRDEADPDDDNPLSLPLSELPRSAPARSFRAHFGCEDRVTGLFKTQLADGIVGMSNDPAALWRQARDAGVVSDGAFSLCFRRESEADPRGTPAGAVVLGGVETALHDADMVFAENARETGFYGVRVRDVFLAAPPEDEELGTEDGASATDLRARARRLNLDESELNAGGTIVDSGTTDTYLNRGVSEEFRREWEAVTGFAFQNDKLKLDDDQLARLPDILVQIQGHEESNQKVLERTGKKAEEIDGLSAVLDDDRPLDVILTITPYHYMEFDSDTDTYFCRVYVDERRGSVIGANTMQSHDVFFDVDNKRIGWAKSDCDFSSLAGEGASARSEGGVTTLSRTDDDHASDDEGDEGAFCDSAGCRLGATAGLLLAAAQAAVAWRAFRRRRPAERVPDDDDDMFETTTTTVAAAEEREIL